ncbi:MAG: penicillin-binding protein 2 [Acidobacteria bacterium]|jgi:penicillin-binding protein 2|nr:MAG: penicillin-binding protein 2 [Acidobacteriota bacterium]GIU82196.1 MAG: penicillin-binding protein 2 [Pyrinomonadaceae bacterium]
MINDYSQNLLARITTVQVIAYILLLILGGRVFYLQIIRGDYYKEKAENQRIKLIPIPAPRGSILDRYGRILVDSRPSYNIVFASEQIKFINPFERVDDYARGLKVDKQYLIERLNLIKKQPGFETMIIKENATIEDIAWVEAHSLEFPELQVEIRPQRNYPYGEVLAHVLGYVGEVSPKQLEKPEYSHLKPGDIVGKAGLEQYYDKYLRGIPGYRKVLVDSRGRIQAELEVVEPQPGQDLITTIDLDLQLAAEAELAKSVTKRGAIIAMDPNNGEILAMASSPSFDPNVFVKGVSTPEGRRKIAEYYKDENRPLLNRAIQGRYHPGSTWKIPLAVAGLQQEAITVKNSRLLCGGGITIGNKFTRCMGNHGTPPLDYAITKSCDGYFYRLGLKLGVDGLIKMVEEFEYDRPTGIDLPNEKATRTPKYWKPYVEKREGSWKDIRTVYASIGQDTVEATPISMLRTIAAIGVQGKMYVPHLMKEIKEIGAVGAFPARPGLTYEIPEPKIIKMTEEQEALVMHGLWGVVNAGGTASRIRIPGFDIAGKTGTAQNAALGTKGPKDHAWFVSFAPAYKPEIAVMAIIENSGFGAQHAAPAVRGVYDAYLRKHHPELVQGQTLAKNGL